MPKTLDSLTPEEIDALLLERRMSLAQRAAKLYCEFRSLRKTAAQLNISHETVRTLLAESKAEGRSVHAAPEE